MDLHKKMKHYRKLAAIREAEGERAMSELFANKAKEIEDELRRQASSAPGWPPPPHILRQLERPPEADRIRERHEARKAAHEKRMFWVKTAGMLVALIALIAWVYSLMFWMFS